MVITGHEMLTWVRSGEAGGWRPLAISLGLTAIVVLLSAGAGLLWTAQGVGRRRRERARRLAVRLPQMEAIAREVISERLGRLAAEIPPGFTSWTIDQDNQTWRLAHSASGGVTLTYQAGRQLEQVLFRSDDQTGERVHDGLITNIDWLEREIRRRIARDRTRRSRALARLLQGEGVSS